jgi:hypothetical protein
MLIAFFFIDLLSLAPPLFERLSLFSIIAEQINFNITFDEGNAKSRKPQVSENRETSLGKVRVWRRKLLFFIDRKFRVEFVLRESSHGIQAL